MASEDGLGAVRQQFLAQVAALGALAEGVLPPDSTLLAACGGQLPLAAAVELAAAAEAQRQRRAAAAAQLAAGREAELLQAAIHAKLRRLAPQKRKVQEEVLLERRFERQCSELQLMDWRRMRRPLPGSNPKAFEPPLQPTALLMQQAAIRAQRAAVAARADRLRQQRTFLEHQQREQLQREQQQQQGQEQQAPAPEHQQQEGGRSGAASAAASGGDAALPGAPLQRSANGVADQQQQPPPGEHLSQEFGSQQLGEGAGLHAEPQAQLAH